MHFPPFVAFPRPCGAARRFFLLALAVVGAVLLEVHPALAQNEGKQEVVDSLQQRIQSLEKQVSGLKEALEENIEADKEAPEEAPGDIYEKKPEEEEKEDFELDKGRRNHFLKLGIGLNNFIDEEEGFNPQDQPYELRPARSIHVNLQLFGREVPIAGSALTFNYAIGFDWYNFFWENDERRLEEAGEGVDFVLLEEEQRKSKLTVSYLNLPLSFRYESHPEAPEKSFRLQAGGYGGLRLSSYTKNKDEDGNKTKRWDDFELNTLRYGLFGRVGYGRLTLYTKYDLNPLFEDGVAPELHPISFGLMVAPFLGLD